MKSAKYLFPIVLMLTALCAGARAQTSNSTTPPPAKKNKLVAKAAPAAATITAADVKELKDALAAQQLQIQQLSQQLRQAQLNWKQAQATATAAATTAAAAQTQAREELQTVGELQSDLAGLKTVSAVSSSNSTLTNNAQLQNAVWTLQDPVATPTEPEILNKQMESPITMRFRGINITPGGYAAAEFVRRSRALGADVPTPFNNLTMPGAS